jgi:hypothetical protein
MLSNKLFPLVFCLFRFNRNIKTLCFGIEANKLFRNKPKQINTNQNKPKQTKKTKQTGKTLNFLKKIPKYAPHQTISVGLLFVLIQSKHRNSLFR